MGPDLSRPASGVPLHTSEPLARGALISKGNNMSGKSTYVKLVLLMLVVAAVAMLLGGDPWGPI